MADRPVRAYYLTSVPTSAGISYQIMTDIDWCDDRLAFSTPDYKVAIEVFEKLGKKP